MEKIVQYYKSLGFEVPSFEYVEATESYREENVIYYKSISDALVLTFNLKIEKIETSLEKRGLMLDLSRLRVYTPETINEIIDFSAMNGINYITMYIEDLLVLEEYSQFGFMRGRYTDEEIKVIVDHGRTLGVEIVPGIQTLGHLEHFLRWSSTGYLRDTEAVLKVGSEETYKFLDVLIKKCMTVFDTKIINIGMDEAFDLGMGSLYREGNTKSQKELFIEHLQKVIEICKENGFETIKMWSDMLFSVYSNKGAEGLYSTNFDRDSIEELNSDVELVYWEYTELDTDKYDEIISIHKQFSDNMSVAFGIHTWKVAFYNSYWYKATEAALKAANKHQIKDVLFTVWHDDGGMCNLQSIYFGIYKTMCGTFGAEESAEVFEAMSGIDYEQIVQVSEIINIGIDPEGTMWNDPISNIYLKSFPIEKVQAAYLKLSKLDKLEETSDVFKSYNLYVEILKLKLEMYLSKDYSKISKLNKLTELFLDQLETDWLKEAKVNGFDDLQKRFSMQICRNDFLARHLDHPDVQMMIEEEMKEEYHTGALFDQVSIATSSRWH